MEMALEMYKTDQVGLLVLVIHQVFYDRQSLITGCFRENND